MIDKNDKLSQKWQNNAEDIADPFNIQAQPAEVIQGNLGDSSCPSGNVGSYKDATEYSKAVHQWLVQYHMWSQMTWFYMSFPMHMMNMNLMQQQQSPFAMTPHVGQPNMMFTGAQQAFVQQGVGNQTQFRRAQAAGTQARSQTANQIRGHEFAIPPLWKRVASEFIDFFLLFVVKLAVTIFFVEYVGLVDLRHYDLEYLMTTDMDYNTAFAMTSELVAMEIVNRVFICIFETLCLRRGLAGVVGGTTPGKRMMGLKVISCREVIGLPGNKILVIPAGNIGTWNALVRSVIKNFSLAFFFPVCLTVFFFQYNRAAYDVISNSVVVESRDRPQPIWR